MHPQQRYSPMPSCGGNDSGAHPETPPWPSCECSKLRPPAVGCFSYILYRKCSTRGGECNGECKARGPHTASARGPSASSSRTARPSSLPRASAAAVVVECTETSTRERAATGAGWRLLHVPVQPAEFGERMLVGPGRESNPADGTTRASKPTGGLDVRDERHHHRRERQANLG